jgi:flagellar L-ring protein precursor FlgH
MKIRLLILLLLNATLLLSVHAGPDWAKLKKLTKIRKKNDAQEPKKIEVIEPAQAEPAAPVEEQPASRASGSLFSEAATGTDLTSDFKPRRVGDLVFVDVIETSNASVSSGAKRSRDSGTLGGLTTAAGALPGPSAAVAAGVMGALGARKYEGKGSTERRSSLQARIAARVIEVLPNGDLIIEARKSVKINHENETLRLSGVIRRRDVAADNAIPTTAIGNLFVELNGKGVASADNAPGWLFRVFEKIMPF